MKPEVKAYLDSIPKENQAQVLALRDLIVSTLPKGFEEEISYGIIGYVVPLSTYPAGYHCTKNTPLPFINLGAKKNYISLHHMGLYASPELTEWFVNEFPKHSQQKLDMGKGCIKFKYGKEMPLDLIGELMTKLTVEDWVKKYEEAFRR